VNAEKAADQAARILDWPLTSQKVIREDEDGNEVTYVFLPSKWSKSTAKTFQDMAAHEVVGSWTTAKSDEDEGETEYDFTGWTEVELATYLQLSEKLSVRKRSHD
jgi:hypothetical protein